MTILLHDLAFQNDVRPSPYCWRVRLALEHKHLPYDTVPTGFAGISAIAGGGHKTVPVLEDRHAPDKRTIPDSWDIALYLDDTYPERPLFGPPGAKDMGKSFALHLHGWLASAAAPWALKFLVPEAFQRIQLQDQGHFRETRERRFGMTLEAFAAGATAEKVAGLRAALEPARALVKTQDYLSGPAPYYPDYVLAGFLFWCRALTPAQVLAADDPLRPWFDRILTRYDRIDKESTRLWDGP